MSRLLALGLLLCALLPSSPAKAGIDPPPASNVLYGFYFSNITLTAAAPGPNYYVIGDVFIQPGVTLTIEPGVTVYFAANHDTLNGGEFFNDSEILCDGGNLIAIGSEADSVHFKSTATTPGKGDWGQISLANGSQGIFRYCSFSFGNRGILSTSSGALTIENCRISHIQSQGLNVTNSPLLVRDCVFDDLNSAAIAVASLSATISRNTITNTPDWGFTASFLQQSNIDSNNIHDAGGAIRLLQPSAASSIRWNKLTNIVTTGVQISGGSSPQTVMSDTVSYAEKGIEIVNGASPDTVRFCNVSHCNYGIYLGLPKGVTIQNCLVYRSLQGGLYAYSTNNGPCSYSVFYSTFTTNGGNGLHSFASFSGSPISPVIKNCIVVNSAQYGILSDGYSFPDIRYVDVWNNAYGGYLGMSCTQACYSINPLFVNSGTDDYHLLPNSPLKVLGEGGTQMGRYGPEQGVVSGVDEDFAEISPAYALPNSPNPFSRSTAITVMAKESVMAALEVFSLNGQVVRRVGSIPLQQGANVVPFEREGLGPGVYFYRISGPGFKQTRKFVVTN